MMGLQLLLKSFGMTVTDEHIAAVEKLIPELPAKVMGAFQKVDQVLAHFDIRIGALEQKMDLLIESNSVLIDALKEEKHGRTNGPVKSRPGSTSKSNTN